MDYDECTDERFSEAAIAYCGDRSVCENTKGSYKCVCDPGYENFVPNVGCSDIDECTDPEYNLNVTEVCGPNTVCHNSEGWADMQEWYNCSCVAGYELFYYFEGN